MKMIKRENKKIVKSALILLSILLFISTGASAAVVKIGLNYPKTGPYSVQGLAQLRAAEMAVDEINQAGGILGRNVELVVRDSQSKADLAKKNVEDLIDNEGVEMIFGGSSSAVAIAGGKAAKSRGKLYFGTLTYSNATTGVQGHKYIFRECYNAWMGAKVLSEYLKEHFSGKRYFYVTADYTWGWTTEASIRKFSRTLDKKRHKRVLTPFPGATRKNFQEALTKAAASRAEVLVLVLFGKDMADAVKLATEMGLKKKMSIVVPNLTLGMAASAGPKVMEGVVGALPWSWKVPFTYNYTKGIAFVEDFGIKYKSYPSTSAASAYTIMYQYKEAVERAGGFDTKAVIAMLEGHKYTLLKDEQVWRAFDHQSIQTVYAVRCKPEAQVLKDKYKQDYFEIIKAMAGEKAARSKDRWARTRKATGLQLAELQW
ncbi:MAG: substrate-binding protein [Desulfobacterales bacterium]|jgi:ABC-type branched-subunit amino acid transport system substrate-binding protein